MSLLDTLVELDPTDPAGCYELLREGNALQILQLSRNTKQPLDAFFVVQADLRIDDAGNPRLTICKDGSSNEQTLQVNYRYFIAPIGEKFISRHTSRSYVFAKFYVENDEIHAGFEQLLRGPKFDFWNTQWKRSMPEIKHPLPPGTVVHLTSGGAYEVFPEIPNHLANYLDLSGKNWRYRTRSGGMVNPHQIDKVDICPADVCHITRDDQVSNPLEPGSIIWGGEGDHRKWWKLTSVNIVFCNPDGHGNYHYTVKAVDSDQHCSLAIVHIFFVKKKENKMAAEILVPGTIVRMKDGSLRKLRYFAGGSNALNRALTDNSSALYRDSAGDGFSREDVKEVVSTPKDENYRLVTRDDQVKNKIIKVGDRVLAYYDGLDQKGTVVDINPGALQATNADGNSHYAYTISFDSGAFTNQIAVCSIHFLLTPFGDAMSTDTKTNPETRDALTIWKDSAIRGLYKGTARRFVHMSKTTIFTFLKTKAPETFGDVDKYLDNKYVDGVLSGALGALLTHGPIVKDHPQAQKVAEELRSDSFSNVFEEVFELTTKTLLPMLMGGLEALNSMENKVLTANAMPGLGPSKTIDTSMVNAEVQEAARKDFEQSLSASINLK